MANGNLDFAIDMVKLCYVIIMSETLKEET